ncbi:MAG: hypothetical protein FP812_15660 [Desulfobacula sp.]|nr:hypothetical protein [Desulfobacula sp.]
MKSKNRFCGMIFFLAGLLTASLLQFSFQDKQDLLADQYSCIRQDLDAYGMTGNIPAPQFTITYNVPQCYGNNGYSIEKVYMYGNQVAVTYKNANSAKSGIMGKSFTGNSSGGFSTIP